MSASQAACEMALPQILPSLADTGVERRACLAAGVRRRAERRAAVCEQRVLEPQGAHAAGGQLAGHAQAPGAGLRPLLTHCT